MRNLRHPLFLKSAYHCVTVTDRLVDQLVYELYGLTEEEIRNVEGGLR
jgi:hypothetical protein